MSFMREFTTIERIEIAGKCEIGSDYLYQVLTGRKFPSPALCLAIERATNGQVTRQELRPGDYWLIWPDLAHLAPTESVAGGLANV